MALGVIKEFFCVDHGDFEASHPICPALGCDSSAVTRVFLTAPKIRHGATSRFDAGIKHTADMYRINNFRSARAGETAYGGDKGKQLGMEVLWGSEVQKTLGRSFAQLSSAAQQPFEVAKRDGSGILRLNRNNAMQEAATEAGITKRVLPRAGDVHADDEAARSKAKAIVS